MTATYSAPNITDTVFVMLRVSEIAPSPLNPRKTFEPEQLADLAASIQQHGVLQPIVVRPIVLDMDYAERLASYDIDRPGYWIVAGERRWRAAQLAGLTEVPANLLGNLTDEQHLRLALIENLQRQDLDPIEEAEGFRQLNRVVGLRQAEIAAAVHRSQPAVANAMRLLELPEDVQERIRKRELSVAHGVALAKWKGFPGVCSHLAQKAVEKPMTSHDIEKWAPESWSLPDTLARGVREHNVAFDVSICKACPFTAYRKGSYEGVCLNPVHWQELQDTALAAQAAEQAAKVAALEASGQKVLPVESYSDFRTIEPRWQMDGCGDDCPCRRSAIRGAKGEVVQICIDPKRFEGLRRAQDDRKKAAAAERLAGRKDQLYAAVSDIGRPTWFDNAYLTESVPWSPPDLVALVVFALSPRYINAEQWTGAGARQLDDSAQAETLRKTGDRDPATLAKELATLPPGQLLRFALDIALTGDIEQAHRPWGNGDEKLAGWYLERRSFDVQLPAAVIDDVPVPETSASGKTVECFLCGDRVPVDEAIRNGPPGEASEWLCTECDETRC